MPSPVKKATPIKINLVADPNFKQQDNRFYSNFVLINHTAFDFTMRFCDMLPIYDVSEAKATGIKKIPVVAEAIIPEKIMPNLIKALVDNYNQYEKTHGNGNSIELVIHEAKK